MRWTVSVELNRAEQKVASRLRRVGKFYLFLREVRHELFDDGFQAELEQAYGKARGTSPLPAAMLAMVTLLQAYDQLSDADAVETAVMDRRWQLVLGCMNCENAPFSQGVLPRFRERLASHNLDQKLLERTVALAKSTGKFGWQHLKAALDSSPLLGAGRVEDTFNLIGRALSTVVTCAAKTLGVTRERVVAEAKLTVLSAPSIKAALDIDWDDPDQRDAALARLLEEVRALEAWVNARAGQKADKPPLHEALALLRRIVAQDLEPEPSGGRRRIRKGVAKDRIPSLGDIEMRHGRKSKTKLFNGYKRHVVMLAGTDLIVGAEVRPANEPEHEALDALWTAAERQGSVEEGQFDRGYLGSPTVGRLHASGVRIRCKPWRSRNGGRFTKEDFDIHLDRATVTCPDGVTAQIRVDNPVVRFPRERCAACAKRAECTSAKAAGRTVTIHPQEALLLKLRNEKRTDEGRRALRERVTVEHSLAKLVQVQGLRARYKGSRKNTLDARRCAAIVNLQTLARIRRAA